MNYLNYDHTCEIKKVKQTLLEDKLVATLSFNKTDGAEQLDQLQQILYNYLITTSDEINCFNKNFNKQCQKKKRNTKKTSWKKIFVSTN